MKTQIALTGKMTTGKSTVSNELVKQLNFEIISVGDSIKKTSNLLIESKNNKTFNSQLFNWVSSLFRRNKTKAYKTSTSKQFDDYLLKLAGDNDVKNAIKNKLEEHFESNYKKSKWERDADGNFIKNQAYRSLTQNVASIVRETLGEKIWCSFTAKEARRLSEQGKKVICDDMRLKSEKEVFERNGFTIIRLEVDKEEQRRRIEKLYGEINEEQLNHITEVDLDNENFDFVVDTTNNSPAQTAEVIINFIKNN